MKKFFTLVAFGTMAMFASAQKTVQGSHFFDNWSVGAMGGATAPMSDLDLPDDIRAAYGIHLTKQITRIFAVSGQVTASNNVSDSKNVIDAMNVMLMGKFNLMNVFAGYTGKPRFFEIQLVGGAGYGRNFYPRQDYNYLTTKAELDFDFNLGNARAWTVSVKPAIVARMNRNQKMQSISLHFRRQDAALELMAGLTYHFKNANNHRHYMTFMRAYDQAEVDMLNAQINDLRGSVSDKEAEINRLAEHINSLRAQVTDARNAKPKVETRTETQVITRSTNSLEQTVTFRQGKSVVDASQLPNVERVATFLRNHRESMVTIKGYASPEGSAEVNARIALARANAVKTILVNKYHIDESRIVAEGQGVGDMFSEPDWNRVSICTIHETR